MSDTNKFWKYFFSHLKKNKPGSNDDKNHIHSWFRLYVGMAVSYYIVSKQDNMKLPFSSEQFLDVFKNYNQTVFPAQLLFYLFALAIIFLGVKKKKHSDKIIISLLALFWLWMGVVYHLIFFATINKAAYVFGLVFILQAILLVYFGIIKNKLSFRFTLDVFGITGALFMLFALLLYPIIGYFQGHIYPYSPTFGLPCPTTIFTFGIFLWSVKKLPILVLVVPLLWSFIGFSAAISLGILEDIGLLVASLTGTALLIVHNLKFKHGFSK